MARLGGQEHQMELHRINRQEVLELKAMGLAMESRLGLRKVFQKQ